MNVILNRSVVLSDGVCLSSFASVSLFEESCLLLSKDIDQPRISVPESNIVPLAAGKETI